MKLKKNRVLIVILFIVGLQYNCSDKKREHMLTEHLQKPEFKNFKIQPELELYLSLLHSKTNTSLTSGIESQFLGQSDSILSYFSVEMDQDSVNDNLGTITRAEALEKIAVDIKPMVEKHKIFQGITLLWTSKNKLTQQVGIGNDVSYQETLDKIANTSKFKFNIIQDTIIFEDYYFNGQQAYSGKILNEKRFGYWKYWWPNGQMKKEGQYDNDEKVGTWTYWDESGRILK
jgi:hypothetical protein